MAQYYALIRRVHGGSSPLEMFCVVTGSENVSPNVRTFATDSHIEDALDGAGVNLLRIWNELRAITSGIPTFIEISEDEARKLELIGG